MPADIRLEIIINGVVQGVGFRPFIYNLAQKHLLRGFVINNSAGVRIEVEGKECTIQSFLLAIENEKPPQSIIESIKTREHPIANYAGFFIRESELSDGFSFVSPDIATCRYCQEEIFSPGLRYNYPFTNCTNCGPRFTIIEYMPYDRHNTTMGDFSMCDECHRQYENAHDRRFHAQPIACPKCGPVLSLVDQQGKEIAKADEALNLTVQAISEGKIIAIKGLGGFLLTCDATNEHAVSTLRKRKGRPHKPLAIMVKDYEAASNLSYVNTAEHNLLLSPQAPIVLVRKKDNCHYLASNIAPDNSYIGVMLPYTPLHHLLCNKIQQPLVMTSGNISEEPILTDNEQALKGLADITDLFLMHNRPISCGYDDSVAYVEGGQSFLLRRARGYAPFPIKTNFKMPVLAAYGSNDKNTFALSKDDMVFISEHIGDMGYLPTNETFAKVMTLYKRLFKIDPQGIVADKHNGYASTDLAKKEAAENDLPITYVQHHHAHIASCMAENNFGRHQKVIGLAFDGTGLGDDGQIWGGEVLICSFKESHQIASLQYMPLAGGDSAVLHPTRLAYGYLNYLGIEQDKPLPINLADEEKTIISQQIEKKINTPFSSSMGRLFDVGSAIIGFEGQISYDAQAAIFLETMALKSSNTLSYGVSFINDREGIARLDIKSILLDILADQKRQVSTIDIAKRIHNTVVQYALQACKKGRKENGINDVCLSGGVFSNRLLLKEIRAALDKEGFNVYYHRLLPSNDGGLSLGQIAIGSALWLKGDCQCV